MVELPYTICFCCFQEQVLMLCRTKPPNAHLWNGLGGKIHSGETPLTCVQREMGEEADIDLNTASSLTFVGIVTWQSGILEITRGMYVYIARLSSAHASQIKELESAEGLIAWKALSWVCDPENAQVVDNIAHFLPLMLEPGHGPCEYFFEPHKQGSQDKHSFKRMLVRPLPEDIALNECQPQ